MFSNSLWVWAFFIDSSAVLTIVLLLQQSFSCMEVHCLELLSSFRAISEQDSALPKKVISTNLLQQKCISTANEAVLKNIVAAKKKDTILVKKDFT